MPGALKNEVHEAGAPQAGSRGRVGSEPAPSLRHDIAAVGKYSASNKDLSSDAAGVDLGLFQPWPPVSMTHRNRCDFGPHYGGACGRGAARNVVFAVSRSRTFSAMSIPSSGAGTSFAAAPPAGTSAGSLAPAGSSTAGGCSRLTCSLGIFLRVRGRRPWRIPCARYRLACRNIPLVGICQSRNDDRGGGHNGEARPPLQIQSRCEYGLMSRLRGGLHQNHRQHGDAS